MPRGFLDPRPDFDDRINFVVTTAEKRRVYELAAREGLPLSAFMRRIMTQALEAANDVGSDRPRAA